MSEPIPGVPQRVNWLRTVSIAFVVVLLVVAALTAFAGASWLLRKGPSSVVAEPAATSAAVEREPTLAELLDAQPDLPGAATVARAFFRDTTGNEIDPGAEAFARWAERRLLWKEFDMVPATSWAKMSKDSVAERGGRICATGRLTEIRVERSAGRVRNEAIMRLDRGDYLTITAVGTSGDLLKGSSAHVCGIATGTWYYTNIGGTQTPSVHIVGAFDLPENQDLRR